MADQMEQRAQQLWRMTNPIEQAIKESPKCLGCGHSLVNHRPMCVAFDGGQRCGCGEFAAK